MQCSGGVAIAGALVGIGRGVAVGLHSYGGFIEVIGVTVGLLLEEFGKVGDLVGDGMGAADVSG